MSPLPEITCADKDLRRLTFQRSPGKCLKTAFLAQMSTFVSLWQVRPPRPAGAGLPVVSAAVVRPGAGGGLTLKEQRLDVPQRAITMNVQVHGPAVAFRLDYSQTFSPLRDAHHGRLEKETARRSGLCVGGDYAARAASFASRLAAM